MSNEGGLPQAARQFREDLDAEMRERFVSCVEESTPAVIGELCKTVSEATGQPLEFVSELLTGIGGLVSLAVTDPGFLNYVADVLAGGSGDTESKSDPVSKEHFRRLLLCEASIGVSSKAQNIIWGHGRVFRDAHVISQIRPIFPSDLNASVDNAVIVHELRLDFREDGFEGGWCVVMDRSQLEELRRCRQSAHERAKYSEWK